MPARVGAHFIVVVVTVVAVVERVDAVDDAARHAGGKRARAVAVRARIVDLDRRRRWGLRLLDPSEDGPPQPPRGLLLLRACLLRQLAQVLLLLLRGKAVAAGAT